MGRQVSQRNAVVRPWRVVTHRAKFISTGSTIIHTASGKHIGRPGDGRLGSIRSHGDVSVADNWYVRIFNRYDSYISEAGVYVMSNQQK